MRLLLRWEEGFIFLWFAVGLRQHSYYWFRAPRDPWPYISVSQLWLAATVGVMNSCRPLPAQSEPEWPAGS
jgi:hypothetical protein